MSDNECAGTDEPKDKEEGDARPTDPGPPLSAADASEYWRVLGLVNDWVKHAESKAAGTLAAASVSAGLLYNLVKDVTAPGRLLDVVAVLAAVCIAAGGIFAAWALKPRLRHKGESSSKLYFYDIARRHPRRTKGLNYRAELQVIANDRDALIADVAAQVWANAHVASDKFRAANVGLTLVLAGIVLLGLTATLVAWRTW